MQQVVAGLRELESREADIARRFWAPELVAETCGAVADSFWDALNASTNKWAVARDFPLGEVIVPVFSPPREVGHGIELFEPARSDSPLAPARWRSLLDWFSDSGWRLAQLELRHTQFDTNSVGGPGASVFHFRADASNGRSRSRATIEGDVRVRWADRLSSEGRPEVVRVDASQLRMIQRAGDPPFREVLFEEVKPLEGTHFIDPLILHDLDGDGLSEILLVANNVVFRRQAAGSYRPSPLCGHPAGLVFTAVVADFDGDGAADLLTAEFAGLRLFRGSPSGTFDAPGELVWTANPHLKYGQVITCGDLDRDGDLDVFLGQYKNPYERGQMPTPYYGANDGHPSYLLLNDARGRFTDATEPAGLGTRRNRRCYGASLVDLDADGDLDLLVVSDFAGLDTYENDGSGHFRDMTRVWLPERHLFGMGCAVSDFDRDGRLDFLALGMHCPTAARLEHLQLKREDRPDYDIMRSRMTAGNRLFLGRAGGGFRSDPLGQSIQRSGWSWGCGAFDWDNDGYPDVYIVNGHETHESVRDYEPEFWLHDIYVGNSSDDLVTSAYFGGKFARTRGQGQSYGGYEKNRLFLNRSGRSFLEAGYLLGVAVEADSRNLATDDLDGDGRVDLIFTTFETWPRVRQTLRVYRNTLEATGNWIGFRLREEPGGISAIGATIDLRYGGQSTRQPILTGDSHRSQHASTAHFGLGSMSEIDSAEVRWADGQVTSLVKPAINRYHWVSPPAR